MGRKIRFTPEQEAAYVDEYIKLDPEARRSMALRLGVRPLTLSVYISKWRNRKKIPVSIDQIDIENNDVPF